MPTLNRANGLPPKDNLSHKLKKLVAYTINGEIICSANKPIQLSQEVNKKRPGAKYLMTTKAAILNQGKVDFGWID